MIQEICYGSTSTLNKEKLDFNLRNKIKIRSSDKIVMLVGAPDGLERHYQNVLAWGGSIENLFIIDICKETIDKLKEFHHSFLSHKYPTPKFIKSDLNEFLEKWEFGKIGVIDFDGTTGLSKYHLNTVSIADSLGCEYLIIVAPSRVQNEEILALAKDLPKVKRRIYETVEDQIARKGYSTVSGQITKWCEPTAVNKFNHHVSSELGHELIAFESYYGVSPMTLSAFKLY